MRLGFTVEDAVQGVGFGPIVQRRAAAHGLCEVGSRPEPLVAPDLAICADCWSEVRSAGRRFHYPFTNCAHCGPRFSIAKRLPYSGQATTMDGFRSCVDCQREYFDVGSRRYHAEPIACPRCGPELAFFEGTAEVGDRGDAALRRAAAAIREGRIVAMKSFGGFQLFVDAENGAAVARLRARKGRPHESFAVLFRGANDLTESARVSDAELRLLTSPEAPIVLVERKLDGPLSVEVAVDGPEIGALLAHTPLHGLLASEVRRPLVCASGNLSDEPVCTTLCEAMDRLGRVADCFLSHDLPIARAMDDSIVRHTARGTMMLRRARGYAPRPLARIDSDLGILAFGANKNGTITLAHRGLLVTSQHLGNLESPGARAIFEQSAQDLGSFFDASIDRVASDLCADYFSTKVAASVSERLGVPNVRVQHHHAHVAAVMAEYDVATPVLGFAWDGAGFGPDGSIWGSEALICEGHTYRRFARLSAFPLLNGNRIVREPRRAALGALFALCPDAIDSRLGSAFGEELPRLRFALQRDTGVVTCRSVGAWFDVVAAVSGVNAVCTFDGQAAKRLEALAAASEPEDGYLLPLETGCDGVIVGNAGLMLRRVCFDSAQGSPPARIARRFHQGLIDFGVRVAERAGIERVVLSGGCFQNRFLLEGLSARLEQAGFSVLVARQAPCNDGAISLGQAWIAAQTPLNA